MKQTITILIISMISTIAVFGQSPQNFNYQTIVRNAEGDPVQNQSVSFQMSIYEIDINTYQETLEYQETHSVTTNEFGLVTFYIGAGTVVSGSLSGIIWGTENMKLLQVGLDINDGSNYSDMGYSVLSSVPYALYAEETGDIDEIVNFAGDTKINMPFNDKSIRFISEDVEQMRLTNTGRLGIGTQTPNAELEVVGSIRMNDGNQAAGRVMVSDYMGVASWADLSSSDDNDWTISGNNMYSAVSGNVGIGTTSPGAKLEVAGHISQTGIGNSVFIGEGAGANDDLSNNTNVFIGRDAGKTNTTGSNNIAIGGYSLQNNSTGAQNIAIGYSSLVNNTTGFGNIASGTYALMSNTTGDYNYATGENVLYSNTTGSYNIAKGVWAMVFNTEGNHNIANGYNSLKDNTVGNENIAIGSRTLSDNTTGSYNIAIGKNALWGNNTGYSNVAIGVGALLQNANKSNIVAIGDSALFHNGVGAYSNYAIENTAVGSKALYTNTTGYNNTATGYKALFSNTGGWNNNAYGDEALYSNEGGSNNNAMGNGALDSNISGSGNVAMGSSSLAYNIDGEFNTALGYASGLSSTGSNNIFIGYRAGQNETGSNKLYISNSSVSSDDALIYGEFDNHILKFNAQLQLTKSTGNEMVIMNSNIWEHSTLLQNFGNGGDHFIMASKEGASESAGIFGDGNNVTIWSAGDGPPDQPNGYLYILDEDNFDAIDYDPYNNGALKAYVNTSGNWVSVSDENKKENIKPLSSSLDKLMSINAYSYNLKQSDGDKAKNTKQETTLGVLAQEVEQVFPEVIEKSDAGDYFVSYSEFIPVLIDAVKEQQQTIETLSQQLEELKSEMDQLRNK